MGKNLKKSFLKGIAWTGVSRFSTRAIQFIVTIILARLLFPEDFGILGMAMLFIQLAQTINQLGLASAIIQKNKVDDEHLSSAFFANLIVSVILCMITILISGLVASFFNNDFVKPILVWLSFMFILGSLRSVQNAILTKELKFNILAIISICETFCSGLISVILAFLEYGVWSLVWGRLFSTFIGVFLTWFLVSWKPKPIFVYSKFKELFKFGANVMGTNALTTVYNNVDYLIIGKFLGSTPLGIYTMAYNIVTLPQRKFSSIITQVAFPVFSKLNYDNARIAKNYLKIIHSISIITFPALVGLLILAPEFIDVLFSEKWEGVIIPMQIMCVVGMLKSVGTTVGAIYYAKGRPGLELKLDIVSVLTLVPLLLLGVKNGIIGVSICVLVHSLMIRIMYFGFLAKMIDIRLIDIFRAISSAIFLSLFMAIALSSYRFGFNLAFHNNIVLLTSAICIGALLYVIMLRKFYRDIYEEAIGPLVKKLTAINSIMSNGRRLTWELMIKK